MGSRLTGWRFYDRRIVHDGSFELQFRKVVESFLERSLKFGLLSWIPAPKFVQNEKAQDMRVGITRRFFCLFCTTTFFEFGDAGRKFLGFRAHAHILACVSHFGK